MATVVRAPFWVPRPADTPETCTVIDWLNSSAVQLTNTQAKFYGQNGQVLTKRWSPYLNLDDPPVWVGPLLDWLNSGAAQLTTTQAKFYGQNGQGYPFRPNFTQDDPAFWVGTPIDNGTIWATTTQAKFYGQPGQGYPFRWNWETQDDPPPYIPPVDWLNSGPIQATFTQAKFFGQNGQGYPFRWNFTQDDPPPWTVSSTPFNRDLLSTTNPFANARPSAWTQDDPPYWERARQASQPIILTTTQVKFYGQAGQGYPFRPNFTQDDASYWSVASTPFNRDLLASISPFANARPSLWTQDDPPSWERARQASQSIILTTTQAKFYGQAGQGYPFRPNFTQDDSSVWAWPPQSWNKNALFQITAPLTHVLPTFYTDDAWVGTPRSTNANTFPQQNPFLHLQPPPYSEDAFWRSTPLPAQPVTYSALQTKFYGGPGQVPPFRPNFTQDDASVWFWPPQRSAAVPLTTLQAKFFGQPGQVPPHFWPFNYDDPAVWWRYVVPALVNYFVIPVPPLPPAGVVYALVRVTATLSNSIVSCVTSVSRLGESGSQTEVS